MSTTLWQRMAAFAAICLLAGCGGGGGYGGSNGNGNGGGGGGGNAPTYVVGGTVSGLSGTVVLRNNGQNEIAVSVSGAFAFTTRIANGQRYDVTVQQHPANPAQQCTVEHGSGTISGADVRNVDVKCVDLPATLQAAELQAEAIAHGATLNWSTPTGASSFNVYVSSARNCDVANFASCPDGERIENVTSPRTIDGLRNGQPYFFQVETLYITGARLLSNEAGARPDAIAFDNDVRGIAVAADGTTYLGGVFTRAGVASGSAVPLDPTTGSIAAADFPFVDGGVVSAIVPDGDGGWYVAGEFTTIGGVDRSRLAHVRADGSIDGDFDPDISSGSISALVARAGVVYVGGSFTVGAVDPALPKACLAAFDAAGEPVAWNPAVANCNGVAALAVGGDGTIYAGGQFDADPTHPGSGRTNVAALGADGKILDGWKVGVDGLVSTLLVAGDIVYVGGAFTRVTSSALGQVDCTNLLAVSSNGVVIAGFQPAPNGAVQALAQIGETLYVGGIFTEIGAGTDRQQRGHLAALNAAGQVLPWHADADNPVNALTTIGDVIYAGGEFANVEAQPRLRLAAIATNGTLLPWHAAPNAQVRSLAAAGGVVYAGGNFTMSHSVPRGHLAALDASGALLPWAPATSSGVFALELSEDTIYIGGGFRLVDNLERPHVAAIGRDGVVTPWQADVAGSVNALAISGDIVYIGGLIASVNQQPRKLLAALRKNGELLEWRPPVTGLNVFALETSGATVYVGGTFTSVDGVHRNLIAAGADGTIDDSFRADPDDTVRALVTDGAVVYAGGDFSHIGPTAPERRGFAALNAAGVADENFPQASRATNRVEALLLADDRLYVGGTFVGIGPASRSNLAAIGVGGQLLDWNPGADDSVRALAINGTRLYVGGQFTRIAGAARSGFGVVDTDGAGELVP